MRELLHKAMIVAAIVLAAALVFAVLYYGLFPRLSYRKLVMAVTAEDALESAEIVRGSHITALTDKQCLGVASWLAEYRSENKGISHADEAGGYELHLHFADKPGHDAVLHVEQNAVIFPGILGQYRIAVENNELYDMISDIVNG